MAAVEFAHLLPLLTPHGITVLGARDLVGRVQEEARERFFRHVLPALTPMTVDAAHPFPRLRKGIVCVVAFGTSKGPRDARVPPFALVPVPGHVWRWVWMSDLPGTWRVLALEEVVRVGLSELYGVSSEECHFIRIVDSPYSRGTDALARTSLAHAPSLPVDALRWLKAGLALDDAAVRERHTLLVPADLTLLCDQIEARRA